MSEEIRLESVFEAMSRSGRFVFDDGGVADVPGVAVVAFVGGPGRRPLTPSPAMRSVRLLTGASVENGGFCGAGSRRLRWCGRE